MLAFGYIGAKFFENYSVLLVMIKNQDEWDELATRAQRGDKQAYHRLLSSLAPYVRNIITPSLAQRDWADDLLQDILMGVHKSLARYIPGQPFRPWVNAIIRYRRAEFISQHYASQGHMKASLDEVEEQGSDMFKAVHTIEDIERALEQLPHQQREVFRMVRIEGYSVKEVAEKTGMTVSAVKVSAHRSAAKLKEFLD